MDKDKLFDRGEQSAENKPQTEKERTIGDIINSPKNQEEMLISAAAKSGVMNQKELEDAGKEKATGANVNKLIGKLEQKGVELNQLRELFEHRKEKEAANEKQQSEEKKQDTKPLEKIKPMALGEETSVLNEMSKALREAAEALKHSGAHSEKSGDVKSQSTPITEEAKQRKEKEAEKKLPPRDGG